VRFVLSPGTTATRLTLKVASDQQVDPVAVDAYPATKTWKTGDAQPWSQRPTYDMKATPVHGALQANGTTLIFNLPPTAVAGVLDLVLVPAAGTTLPPTFDLALEPPTSAALTTSSSASTVPPSSPSSSAFVPQASPPAFALAPPLPALGSVGIVRDQPRIAAPLPAAVAPVPAAATTPSINPAARIVTGRSRRDMALLIFLLADGMFYLGWLSRGSRSRSGTRLSIYDMPPATTD
jgi:xanthine/CO dehydrogenase XdhC/CoxF family maturation factor